MQHRLRFINLTESSGGLGSTIYLRERTGCTEAVWFFGKMSWWNAWRPGLPWHPNVGALARMETWAKALDPQPRHARHVATLAVELYDGLCASGLLNPSHKNGRETLRTAALMHEIGR